MKQMMKLSEVALVSPARASGWTSDQLVAGPQDGTRRSVRSLELWLEEDIVIATTHAGGTLLVPISNVASMTPEMPLQVVEVPDGVAVQEPPPAEPAPPPPAPVPAPAPRRRR